MVETMLSYWFIAAFCLATGLVIADVMTMSEGKTCRFFSALVFGMVTITVIAGYLSVFMRIGLAATLLILILDVGYIIVFKKRVLPYFKGILCYSRTHRWEIITYVVIAVIISYFNSRGNFHTDTNLYHGLAFILFTSCLGVAVYLYEKRTGFRRLFMGSAAILTVFLMLSFVDHYFGDNLGFASMHKFEPYYISQKDYDIVETSIFRVGDIEINGGNGSINSYYAYLGTIGPYADSRLDSLGEKFEDGFYMRK